MVLLVIICTSVLLVLESLRGERLRSGIFMWSRSFDYLRYNHRMNKWSVSSPSFIFYFIADQSRESAIGYLSFPNDQSTTLSDVGHFQTDPSL